MFLALSQAVIGAALVVTVAGDAPRNGPPKLDVRSTCHASRRLDDQARSDRQACMRSELAARDEVRQLWGKAPADVRARCSQEVRIGGVPSYVELAVCLQMNAWSRDAGDPAAATSTRAPASRAMAPRSVAPAEAPR